MLLAPPTSLHVMEMSLQTSCSLSRRSAGVIARELLRRSYCAGVIAMRRANWDAAECYAVGGSISDTNIQLQRAKESAGGWGQGHILSELERMQPGHQQRRRNPSSWKTRVALCNGLAPAAKRRVPRPSPCSAHACSGRRQGRAAVVGSLIAQVCASASHT